MFRKLLDSGEAGDNIGVLLRGVERTDVERVKYFVNQVLLHLILNLNVKLTS